MKITLIALEEDVTTEWLSSSAHGSGSPVTQLAAEAAAVGHDVTIVTSRDPDGTALGFMLGSRGALRLLWVDGGRRRDAMAAQALRNSRPDVVHAFGVAAASVTDAFHADTGVPWVWSPFDRTRMQSVASLPLSVDPTVSPQLALVPTMSHARQVPMSLAVDNVPLSVSARLRGNHVDSPTSPRVRRLLTVLDEDGSGAEDAIRALTQLPGMQLDVVCRNLYVGEPQLVREASLLSRRLHVAPRVRYLRNVSPPAFVGLLALTDVFVHVPHRHASLRAVASAMAAGCVLVVTGADGADELVQHGSSGSCVEAANPRRLSTTLRILDLDVEHRDGLRASARQRAREIFDWKLVAARTLSAYEDVRVAQVGAA